MLGQDRNKPRINSLEVDSLEIAASIFECLLSYYVKAYPCAYTKHYPSQKNPKGVYRGARLYATL